MHLINRLTEKPYERKAYFKAIEQASAQTRGQAAAVNLSSVISGDNSLIKTPVVVIKLTTIELPHFFTTRKVQKLQAQSEGANMKS